MIVCYAYVNRFHNDEILTTHCSVGTWSSRHGITHRVTGCSITYFRFGHVSGTQSTTITSGSKVPSVAHCKKKVKSSKSNTELNERRKGFRVKVGTDTLTHVTHAKPPSSFVLYITDDNTSLFSSGTLLYHKLIPLNKRYWLHYSTIIIQSLLLPLI